MTARFPEHRRMVSGGGAQNVMKEIGGISEMFMNKRSKSPTFYGWLVILVVGFVFLTILLNNRPRQLREQVSRMLYRRDSTWWGGGGGGLHPIFGNPGQQMITTIGPNQIYCLVAMGVKKI